MTVHEQGLRPRWSNLFFPFNPQVLQSTAAAPAHNGEYLWEQFRCAVRPGQIWRTSNSLIRIDRLVHNRDIRRDARYIKFVGAWTGSGPRALKALLPQRDGQFLSSTGPWSVSRRFEPFLLIQSDVRPGMAIDEGAPEIDLQDEPTAQYEPMADLVDDPLDTSRVEQYPRVPDVLSTLVLRADAINSPALRLQDTSLLFSQAYDLLGQWLADHAHDRFGQPAFNVKIQRLDIPDDVRARVDEHQMESIINRFTAEYVADFEDMIKDRYPWVTGTYLSGRSGGWLEIKIDPDRFASVATSGQFYEEALGEALENEAQDIGAMDFFDAWWANRFEGEEDPDEQEILTEFVAMLIEFREQLESLDSDVQAALSTYQSVVESDMFWAQYME